MADFYTSWDSSWTAEHSSSTAHFYGYQCDFACEMMSFEPITIFRTVLFLASNSEEFGIKVDGEANNTQYSQHDTKTENMIMITDAAHNADVLSATNGGTLLTLANQYKDEYFDGQTQTAASLKAHLDAKYGEHTYYWSGLGTGYNVLSFPDVQVEYPATVTNSMGYTWPLYDRPTYDPTTATNPVVSFSGVQLDWPQDIRPSYDPDDRPAFRAWWIFEQASARNELQFDVWVNGTKDPNVAITWQAISKDDSFSLAYVNPIIWCSPNPTLGHAKWAYHEYGADNIYEPDESNPYLKRYGNAWSGSYLRPFLTEFETDVESMNTATRVANYGVDGIAGEMYYQMRFDCQIYENNTGRTTWGSAFGVTVPREVTSIADISVFTAPDSERDPQYASHVVIHLGESPDQIPDDSDDYPQGTDPSGQDPGVYQPDKTPHDFSDGDPTGFDGKAILTRTYTMNAATLQNIGSKLWSQSYFDVLKIQSNPIENIVSCKWFPFSLTGTTASVKVGDVDFEINAGKVDTIYSFTVGSVYYYAANPSKPTYLDGSPYTLLLLHLPYCGTVELDASLMINRKITVKYVVDLVTGDCVAFIILDGGSGTNVVNYPYMAVSGHCGVDIPLTATDRIQSEIRAASTVLSAVGSAAAGVMSGDFLGAGLNLGQGGLAVAGMDVTSQRTSQHSPACMTHENRNVFLEIWRPAFDGDLLEERGGFAARHGWPCNKFMTLSSFSGYTRCSRTVKVDFAMSSRENEMIEQLLTGGVYI